MFVARLLATAVLVITVARVAERSGPFLASIILTLPLFAGPSYFFLMMEVSAQFIAESALVAFAGTGAVLLFTLGFVLIVQRFGLLSALLSGTLAWGVLALPLQLLSMTLLRSMLLVGIGVLVVTWGTPKIDLHARPATTRASWRALILRSLVAGCAVAAVSSAGAFLGPKLTGLLVTYPLTLSVSAWMIYRQYGARFTATVLTAVQRTLPSYSSFCLVLALCAEAVGAPTAFCIALLASLVSAGGLAWFGTRARRTA